MHVDIETAGAHAASELRSLHGSEGEGPVETTNSVGVTLMKILTLIAGFFFSFVAATTLPADLAFISITLLGACSFALIAGSEKIVAVFPRNLWVYRSYYPTPPAVTHHHIPATPSLWRRFRPSSLFPIRRATGLAQSELATPRPRRGQRRPLSASAHPFLGGSAGSSPYSAKKRVPPAHSAATVGGTHNVSVGTRGASSSLVSGTNNVAVGSRVADSATTTPGGNVLVGSRRRKNE